MMSENDASVTETLNFSPKTMHFEYKYFILKIFLEFSKDHNMHIKKKLLVH